MRDRRRASRGPSWAVTAAAALFLASCQSDFFSSLTAGLGAGSSGAERTDAVELPLGSWTRDSLHCAEGRCERWYEIEVNRPGTLRVDVYAPVGKGLPDCELSLETETGEALPARVGRVQTRRRLRYEGEAETYRLRIASAGQSQELFEFEVVAEVREPESKPAAATPAKPPARARPVAKPSPRPEIPIAKPPEPAESEASALPAPEPEPPPPTEPPPPQELVTLPEPPPPPGPIWVVAEVLDVEEAGGTTTAVMLEAGAPDGISPGMQGELYEGDTVIGRIEVVDVYPSGSRARITSRLTAPISFDTLSRIEVPPGTPGATPETTGK